MSKGLLGPTHNLMSNIMAHSKQPTPEVGMGATQLWAKDRHAGTIVAVYKNAKGEITKFEWQQDIATRTDKNGMSDAQSYSYAPNTEARKVMVRLRKNGRWVTDGESLKHGTSYLLGDRREFYDFTF